jgi:hypothetical protein
MPRVQKPRRLRFPFRNGTTPLFPLPDLARHRSFKIHHHGHRWLPRPVASHPLCSNKSHPPQPLSAMAQTTSSSTSAHPICRVDELPFPPSCFLIAAPTRPPRRPSLLTVRTMKLPSLYLCCYGNKPCPRAPAHRGIIAAAF